MKLKISFLFLILAAIFTYVMLNGSYFSIGSEKTVLANQEATTSATIFEKLYTADLKDYQGKKINIDEGSLGSHQAVVIHLWASWCGPCVAEVPELVEFSKKNPNVSFVIISLDETQDSITKFLKSFPGFGSEKYIKIWDNSNSLSKFFNVDRLPMSVIIRQNKSEPQFIRAPVDWRRLVL